MQNKVKHSSPKEIGMGATIYGTPIVANDVLFVATRYYLFAIQDDAARPE